MLQIGDWQVDAALDEIRRDDAVVKLEPRTMRLLCCLAERPGEVWSANALLERVWPGVIVNPGSVYQVIAQLRKQLGDDGEEARYIATVPRKGYRLIAPVTQLPAQSSVSSSVTETAGMPTPRRFSVARYVSVAVALLAVAAAGTWMKVSKDGPPVVRAQPTLVVLPLADLSADATNADFCAGLTDELTNALGRVSALRVTGRTSALRAREAHADAREIGRLLGVTHVLEGSVRVTGTRMRVSAQLISTADGFQVWSNSFDRPRTDALGIQTEVSRAVIDALELQLTADQSQALDRASRTAPSAYELYLLGRHQQLRRTPESIDRAIAYQKEAIAADPKFALAHAGLADAYMARYYYKGHPLIDTQPLVKQEVDAALRLDPELAEAYTAWGVFHLEDLQFDDALKAFSRAVSINSNSGVALLGVGTTYEFSGQPREAIRIYDQAALLDPLHTQLHIRRCTALQTLGRFGDADRACQRAFELQPEIPNAPWFMGFGAYGQGRLASAIDRYKQALARAPRRVDLRSELGLLYLDIGLPELAAEQFEQVRSDGADAGLAPASARQFVASGDRVRLATVLRETDWSNTYARVRLDAAHLADMAGDPEQVARLLATVARDVDAAEEDIRPALYALRWGVCELCSLARLERSRGDLVNAERHERFVLDWLREIEENGDRWPALHYARATIHAQRGDTQEALTSLERAIEQGWRRAWQMRTEPSLATLRGQQRFASMLRTIDDATAIERARLAEPAQARLVPQSLPATLSAQTPTR